MLSDAIVLGANIFHAEEPLAHFYDDYMADRRVTLPLI